MAGMFFWAIGRSVYDCTHATKDVGHRMNRGDRMPDPRLSEEERLERGVHVNQLNPLRAIATARWEAFKFKENPKPVPAIQFMFYANTHLSSAGFFESKENAQRSGFQPLNQQNYEFIVDLPEPVLTRKSEYPIGHTPDFALNTLVLQPRLVVDAQFEPFTKTDNGADGIFEDSADRARHPRKPARGPTPIVELFGARPNQPARQALVRIPLKDASADDNSYGVLLSIGWLDTEAVSAKKVKKVTVTLVAIEPEDPDSDNDWNVNIGVNGRWFMFRFQARARVRTDLASISGGVPVKVEMLLAEEDMILVSAHGFEEDPLDDTMRSKPEFRPPERRPPKEAPKFPSAPQVLQDPASVGRFVAESMARVRVITDRIMRRHADVEVPEGPPDLSGNVPKKTIKVPMVGDEMEWEKDVDTDDEDTASRTARALFLKLAVNERFDSNDVIGMIDANVEDPFHLNPPARRRQDGTDSENPMVVRDVIKRVGLGGTRECQVSAYKTEFVGRTAAMGYDPNLVDYTLFFDVKVEDLPAS
jgi:hypothetical protein